MAANYFFWEEGGSFLPSPAVRTSCYTFAGKTIFLEEREEREEKRGAGELIFSLSLPFSPRVGICDRSGRGERESLTTLQEQRTYLLGCLKFVGFPARNYDNCAGRRR